MFLYIFCCTLLLLYPIVVVPCFYLLQNANGKASGICLIRVRVRQGDAPPDYFFLLFEYFVPIFVLFLNIFSYLLSTFCIFKNTCAEYIFSTLYLCTFLYEVYLCTFYNIFVLFCTCLYGLYSFWYLLKTFLCFCNCFIPFSYCLYLFVAPCVVPFFILLQTANRKRRKYIDYGKEIPFQRNAPAGFYDVSEENEGAKRARQDPAFSTKWVGLCYHIRPIWLAGVFFFVFFFKGRCKRGAGGFFFVVIGVVGSAVQLQQFNTIQYYTIRPSLGHTIQNCTIQYNNKYHYPVPKTSYPIPIVIPNTSYPIPIVHHTQYPIYHI